MVDSSASSGPQGVRESGASFQHEVQDGKNVPAMVRVSLKNRERGRTDWTKVDALSDEDIERSIAEDPDAAPILDEEWFRNAVLEIPAKIATSIRVDGDVMAWFRSQGRGWQTRMNTVLRTYAKAQGGVK